MRIMFKNISYFLKELKTIFKLNLVSNILSIISLAFIFFLLSMIISSSWVVKHMVKSVQGEAEISIYYKEDLDTKGIDYIKENLLKIDGVKEAILINEDEAKEKMVEVLGKESKIINLFEHNPFSPYIEVKLDLVKMDSILESINTIKGIELIRDNKEILEKLIKISDLINFIALFIIVAVGTATLVITSHIIRQGIYNSKDEIYTLRLLGAPEGFIVLPFLLQGILMSLIAGCISIIVIAIFIGYLYSNTTGVLPFIVLPSFNKIITDIIIFSMLLSLVLGLLGSILGIKSTRQ